jgi:hypothetical protein
MEQIQGQPQRKGMSKGCLIALIVGGALLLIIALGLTLICVNRDKVVQSLTRVGFNQIKTEVARSNFAGLDTTRFNGLVDSFLVRLKTQPLDSNGSVRLYTSLQQVTTDKKIDAEDVTRLLDMMIACYPDLAPYRPEFGTLAVPPKDSTAAPDTAHAADTAAKAK